MYFESFHSEIEVKYAEVIVATKIVGIDLVSEAEICVCDSTSFPVSPIVIGTTISSSTPSSQFHFVSSLKTTSLEMLIFCVFKLNSLYPFSQLPYPTKMHLLLVSYSLCLNCEGISA